MKGKILTGIILFILVTLNAFGQTNTDTILQSGWYRIAINGPLVLGESGGSRAAARFIITDVTSGFHQTTEFLAYVHYGKRPSLAVLNNSYYYINYPPFKKIRIVKGGTYEGASVEVYVAKASKNNDVTYYLENNVQRSGWMPVDWQMISASSGDTDGVPEGFSASVIDLEELVQGYVTDGGQQKSYFNGNFYTSGNVGIRTMNPQSELSVDGTITAKQMKVTQTGWADFVFDSTYDLKPLLEIERYIRSNKCLPGMPSANQMAEEGNDLGKTDAQLLQKIEELTLYLIRQRKEILAQNERMDLQRQLLRQQEKRINVLEQLLAEKQQKAMNK